MVTRAFATRVTEITHSWREKMESQRFSALVDVGDTPSTNRHRRKYRHSAVNLKCALQKEIHATTSEHRSSWPHLALGGENEARRGQSLQSQLRLNHGAAKASVARADRAHRSTADRDGIFAASPPAHELGQCHTGFRVREKDRLPRRFGASGGPCRCG